MNLSAAKGALEDMRDAMRVLKEESQKNPFLTNGRDFHLAVACFERDHRFLLAEVTDEQKFQESQPCSTS